jgi:hypothetical protein
METLDPNVAKTLELACTKVLCLDMGPGVLPACGDRLHQMSCPSLVCQPVCQCLGPLCKCLTGLTRDLAEGLKACSGEFYTRCPGFERIEKYCEFEPAIEAAKFKEQAQLDRIAKLEARVQELELKKRG